MRRFRRENRIGSGKVGARVRETTGSELHHRRASPDPGRVIYGKSVRSILFQPRASERSASRTARTNRVRDVAIPIPITANRATAFQSYMVPLLTAATRVQRDFSPPYEAAANPVSLEAADVARGRLRTFGRLQPPDGCHRERRTRRTCASFCSTDDAQNARITGHHPPPS